MVVKKHCVRNYIARKYLKCMKYFGDAEASAWPSPRPESANQVFARQLRAPRARVCGCHQAFEWASILNRLSQHPQPPTPLSVSEWQT